MNADSPSRTLLLALLCLLPVTASASPQSQTRTAAVDSYDAVLIDAAREKSLPRPLAPVRRALVDQTIRDLRRGDQAAAMSPWRDFCAGYFSPMTQDDVQALVGYVLREAYLVRRPGTSRLAKIADSTRYLSDRALAVTEYLDELEAALENRRKGFRPSVRRLELGPREYRFGAEPYRFSRRPRPATASEIKVLIRDWERRLVAVQEDAILAHIRLHGGAIEEPELVRTMREVSDWLTAEARARLR